MPSPIANAVHSDGNLHAPAASCAELGLKAAMENCHLEDLHHSLESCSFSSASLSSISHSSSSVRVFFFLPSFSFFSRSLIAFLASFALSVTLFLTSILF